MGQHALVCADLARAARRDGSLRARFECLVGQADRDVTGSGPLLEVINTVLLDLLDDSEGREGFSEV
jgi:hypothetical protein